MDQPLALLLLEDIDQPYTDDKRGDDDEETEKPPVIEGVDGLRKLLGVQE